MSKLIEGFKRYKAHIKTKSFLYKKGSWEEWITMDNDIIVRAETEKAVLVIEKILKDEEMYSRDAFWIPKSRIISIEKCSNILSKGAEKGLFIKNNIVDTGIYRIVASVTKSEKFPRAGYVVNKIWTKKCSLLPYENISNFEVVYDYY